MKEETMTIERARQVLEKENATKIAACWEEIQRALRKFECQIVSEPVIMQDGRISANIKLFLANNTE